jgi:hypothetical protein
MSPIAFYKIENSAPERTSLYGAPGLTMSALDAKSASIGRPPISTNMLLAYVVQRVLDLPRSY